MPRHKTKTSFKKGDPRLIGNKFASDYERTEKQKESVKKAGIPTRFKKDHIPWHKGKSVEEHPAFKGFRYTKNRSPTFKKILIEEIGKCERCGISNKKVLILHHKNRDSTDNSRDNLELLCANCHTLEHWG